jgi:hypothetical protein
MRPSTPKESAGAWGIAELFIITQTVFPALLFFPAFQVGRLPIRVSAYAISLGLLAWVYWSNFRLPKSHPALPWLWACIICLLINLVHPQINSLASAFAQAVLYLAVLAPVLWASAVVRNAAQLQRLLWIILICSGINSIVAIMQVQDPDHWLPKEFAKILTEDPAMMASVTYEGKDGERIIRPSGLFDTPGAAAGPGLFAGILGLFMVLETRNFWGKAIALGLAFAGLAAIYLTQVRSSLLIFGGMVVACLVVLARQRRYGAILMISGISVALMISALILAVSLGGPAVQERVLTLIGDKPGQVYYNARGVQMEDAVLTILPKYPFGAGPGRWGMMQWYFGDPGNRRSPSLWAEIQIPGWILDGGLILLICYAGALIVTSWYEFQLFRTFKQAEERQLSAIIFAVNFGVVAFCFSFTPFVTQVGQQYWFLAGCVHGLAVRSSVRRKKEMAKKAGEKAS